MNKEQLLKFAGESRKFAAIMESKASQEPLMAPFYQKRARAALERAERYEARAGRVNVECN